jgi:hypothetical protein
MALAYETGVPRVPVAESVPSMAHRNLLGPARGADHIRGILEFCLETEAGAAAVFKVGGFDGESPGD